MNKRVFSLILVFFIFLLLPLMFFFGNPLSYLMITLRGNKYLQTTYPNSDLKVQSIVYDFKRAAYITRAASSISQDTHFLLFTDWFGNISGDQYGYVTSGANTMERLGTQYRSLVDNCFDSGNFPWPHTIAYGELIFRQGSNSDTPDYGLDPSILELDGQYDIQALGAAHGRITLYLHDETVSIPRAAELLLAVTEYLDARSIPFRGICLTLCAPLNAAGQNVGQQITFSDFLHENIYEDGLIDRLTEKQQTAPRIP